MSTSFIESLAARRRFGMRPGLDAIRALCAALGDPQKKFRVIHVAGTNGKGAVCALLSAALGKAASGRGGAGVARYTSPHLMKLNERFVIDGSPISDDRLEFFSEIVHDAISRWGQTPIEGDEFNGEVTFFEALTAVAFLAFADARPKFSILECGLGGRLDATNVCEPELCIITRIGFDHCDWLGDTVEKIAAEKAGIVKPGIPVVLGANDESVRDVVAAKAAELGAPFFYAPDLSDEGEIPADLPLRGAFNRENAVTALAALKALSRLGRLDMKSVGGVSGGGRTFSGFANAVWPGRYQRVGDYIVDGAHNPPAAAALAKALSEDFNDARLPLVAGFCGDKDVVRVLRTLVPHVSHGFAVRTNNPRSLSAEETAAKMREAGIAAEPCGSLAEALRKSSAISVPVLVCGSLFLAGEALAELGAYPWGVVSRADPSEALRGDGGNLV